MLTSREVAECKRVVLKTHRGPIKGKAAGFVVNTLRWAHSLYVINTNDYCGFAQFLRKDRNSCK